MRNKGLIHPCLVEHNRDGNLDSFGPKPAGAEMVGLAVRITKSNVNTVYMVWVLYFQYAHDLGGWAKPAEVTAMSVDSHIDFSLHLWVTQSASVRDRINSDNSSERSWQSTVFITTATSKHESELPKGQNTAKVPRKVAQTWRDLFNRLPPDWQMYLQNSLTHSLGSCFKCPSTQNISALLLLFLSIWYLKKLF